MMTTRRIGVLWSRSDLFRAPKETIRCSSKGKQLVVTNNGTKPRADYKKKFDSMGIPCKVVRRNATSASRANDMETGGVFGSAYSHAAIYIAHILNEARGSQEQSLCAWGVEH